MLTMHHSWNACAHQQMEVGVTVKAHGASACGCGSDRFCLLPLHARVRPAMTVAAVLTEQHGLSPPGELMLLAGSMCKWEVHIYTHMHAAARM